MKIGFTVLLVLILQDLLFLGCEDPSLEEITINELKQQDIQALEIPEKFVCWCCFEPQPEFPGGTIQLLNFIASNLEYPLQQRYDNIEGTVFISFVIDKDGSLSDFEIKRSVHPALDAEALRVLRLMPNWITNKENEHPARTIWTMPVKFKLTK